MYIGYIGCQVKGFSEIKGLSTCSKLFLYFLFWWTIFQTFSVSSSDMGDQQGSSKVLYWRMSAGPLSHRFLQKIVLFVGPHTLSGLSGILAHLAEVDLYRVGWTNLSLLTSGYIGFDFLFNWWLGLTCKVRVSTLTSTDPVSMPRDVYFGSTHICLICDP